MPGNRALCRGIGHCAGESGTVPGNRARKIYMGLPVDDRTVKVKVKEETVKNDGERNQERA